MMKAETFQHNLRINYSFTHLSFLQVTLIILNIHLITAIIQIYNIDEMYTHYIWSL